MKFLIVGDIHLRLNTPISRKDNIEEVFRDKFKQLRNIIIDNEIDAVLNSGDLLDKSFVGNETMRFAEEMINSLEIPFIMCLGNHCLKGNSVNNYNTSSISILQKLCDNLIIPVNERYIDLEDVRIYLNHYGNDNFIIDDLDTRKQNIILTHSMIVNGETMFDSINLNEVNTNADLLITGHNHCKFHKGKVYNAGALIRLTSGKGDMDREVEVAILDSDTMILKKILLNITPQNEAFDVKEIAKKQSILDDYVIQELNKAMSNITSTQDIVNLVIEESNPTKEAIDCLKNYLDVV